MPTPRLSDSLPSRTHDRAALTVILFVVYLALLVWLVMWKFESPWVADGAGRDIKLVPYVQTATAGANPVGEIAANVAIFVPFGMYVATLAPTWASWRAAGVFAGVSLALEIGQYVLATGASDTADVIDNTVGGLLGIAAIALLRRSLPGRATALVTRVLFVGTVAVAVAVAAFIASPIRMGPHNPGHLRHFAGPESTLLPRPGN
ncbi:hypothetical protein GCM10022286_19720 [Gryllotalpicola daejeonensis]|uniref:VanZ-like domain-containing protein n=1 Tax=Gryllotalpicola daejeonensis TaxID=993087 RepID=A0ABP7ZKJ9_9MICO